MNQRTRKRLNIIFPMVAVAIVSTIVSLFTVTARASTAFPTASSYEMAAGTGYYYNQDTKTEQMSFGSSTAGRFSMSGSLSAKTQFRGTEAYGVESGIEFNYVCDNSVLCQNDVNQWVIHSNSVKSVNGTSLGEKMNKGAIIVQKSQNKQIWTTEHIQTNVFETQNTDVLNYSPNEEDLKIGSYYRVIVAYEIRHKTGTSFFIPKYEYRECVEVYEFYLANDNSSVVARDLLSSETLDNSATTSFGFKIDDNKSGNLVSVKHEGTQNVVNAKRGMAFYEPGVYTITETTKLGVTHVTKITVESGLDVATFQGITYQSDDNSGYQASESQRVVETVFGANSYTSINIAVSKNFSVQQKFLNGYNAVGVNGPDVYILLKTNPSSLGDKWVISNDGWGGMDGETVNGILAGQVGTGAVILQKSQDGSNWQFCSNGIYQNGIFTTDYENSFGSYAETCLYVPSGDEVIDGYFYRIYYAYEVKNVETGECKNIIEMYSFRLMNGNLGSITFHNLTISNPDNTTEGDDFIASINRSGETLVDGALTVTGFNIDTSLNHTASVEVFRNEIPYTVGEDGNVTEDGEYLINLSDELGNKQQLTIYVCKLSLSQMYAKLFGDSFITGKRIFSYDKLPMYEGGYTQMNLNALSDYDSPSCIVVYNETTAKTEFIEWKSEKFSVVLTEAGRYTVTVITNATYLTDVPVGDNNSFVFKFDLIQEGTAPGPVVNEGILQKYGDSSNPSNTYPVYYGVSYISASRGYITLAFANWQDAYNYVYQHEKGMVEVQPDGSYRYNGNFFVSQKEKYSSGWDLTDAIDFFTRIAIKESYFDLSDEFTYLTLTEQTIASVENLRTLELDRSVIIFANEEQRDALISSTGLTLINSKKYAYLTPGMSGEADRGYHHFMFIKDENGYDSASVVIVDCKGNSYNIEYNVSVGDQLKELGCATGKIIIEEENIYGDTNVYEAIYIAENDNTISFDLKYVKDNVEYIKHISSANNGECIVVDAFCIDNVMDQLNDLGLVIISNGKIEDFYAIDNVNIKNNSYYTNGSYEVTVLNRLGYKYTVTVKIETSSYNVIKIDGKDGNDAFSFVYTDTESVVLPLLSKYGYTHSGFKTEDGTFVSKEVDAILLKGYSVLEAVWEAKKFNVNLYVGDDLYCTAVVAFGEAYALPTISDTDDACFIGWGDECLTGTLVLNVEGDVTLVASFEDVIIEPETGTNSGTGDNTDNNDIDSDDIDSDVTDDTDTGTKRSTVATVFLIIGIVIGALIVIVTSMMIFLFEEWDIEECWFLYVLGGIILIVCIILLCVL